VGGNLIVGNPISYIGGVVLNETVGNITSGNVIITATTPSTSITTGALRVSGGAGIIGNIYLGGNIFVNSSTESTSTTSGALTVTGGVGIGKRLNVGGDTYITSTTESTSTTSGALRVSGGAGVAGRLNVGGNLIVGNPISYIGGVVLNETVGNITSGNVIITATTPSTDINTGALRVTGGVGIGGRVNVGGNIIFSDTLGTKNQYSSGYITEIQTGILRHNVPSGASHRLSVNSSDVITVDSTILTVGGNIFVNSTTASTTTTSGALRVGGGAGIIGNIYLGGNIFVNSSTESTSTTSGALTVTGGVGIGKRVNVGGDTYITSTTASSSIDTGALEVSGGAGIIGNLYVGGNVVITATTPATSATTGALRVSGGTSIQGNLHIGPTFNGQTPIGSVYVNETTGRGPMKRASASPGDKIITNSSTTGSLIISHNDLSGTSSILFTSANNSSSDFGYIQYLENMPYSGSTSNESALLLIGIENDATSNMDRIALYSGLGTGYVGINNLYPTVALDVSGNIKSNGTITAPTFSGALSGTATIATYVTVLNDTTSANRYITFVNGNVNNGNYTPQVNEFLVYNPGTNTLFCSSFHGNANSANNATNVTITNETVTANEHYIVFTDGISGSRALDVCNTKLKFVPSTGQLTAITFNATSDYRMKQNVYPLTNKIIDSLNPVEYDLSGGKHDMGFLAHEVQEIFPFLVSGEKDGENMQSLNYNGFIALLVKEVQVLKKENTQFKQEITEIREQLSFLMKRI
jgi:hypothetical protein